jgi:DNA-directed RNA polymerase specialized sigma24 family protein
MQVVEEVELMPVPQLEQGVLEEVELEEEIQVDQKQQQEQLIQAEEVVEVHKLLQELPEDRG